MYAPKNSFFITAFNEKIMQIKAAGLIDFWLSQDVDERFKYYNLDFKEPKALILKHLLGCFYILGIGYLASILVFIYEVLKHKYQVKKSKKFTKKFKYLK